MRRERKWRRKLLKKRRRKKGSARKREEQQRGGRGPSILSESRLPSSAKVTFSDQDHHFRLCSTRRCHGIGGGAVGEETKGGGAYQPVPNPHLYLFRGNHKAE